MGKQLVRMRNHFKWVWESLDCRDAACPSLNTVVLSPWFGRFFAALKGSRQVVDLTNACVVILGMSCSGPGGGLNDPCGFLPTEDSLWLYDFISLFPNILLSEEHTFAWAKKTDLSSTLWYLDVSVSLWYTREVSLCCLADPGFFTPSPLSV